jgi:hypothetical protein
VSPDAGPLLLLVAAPPDAPGVADLLGIAETEARAGGDVRVLFTDAGLDALASSWPLRLEDAGARATLCARSARERRLDPRAAPASVLWSSLTTFLGDVPAGARLWSAFP